MPLANDWNAGALYLGQTQEKVPVAHNLFLDKTPNRDMCIALFLKAYNGYRDHWLWICRSRNWRLLRRRRA